MFKIKEIKPMFTGVVTTANTYVGESLLGSGIIDTRKMGGTINPYQYVVSVGPMATGLKKGDVVRINLKRYAFTKHTPGAFDEAENKQYDDMSNAYVVPKVEIDGKEYLFLQNNDIEFVVTDYEVDEGGLLQ